MKILLSILSLLIISIIIPIYAELDVAQDGSVTTAILRTPEFTVDTSEFSQTNEITMDVKFENTGSNGFYGIAWNTETPYDENGLDDPDEVYEKYADERRFYFVIYDITNSDKIQLDSTEFTSTSDDKFIQINGYSELQETFEVEILDIDELVPWTSTGKAIIQTHLKLSSPEFVKDNKYELLLWTASDSSDNRIPFTIFSESEETKSTPQPPTPVPTEMPSDIEEQMKLQQQNALEEHDERKKQKEAEQKELEKLHEENKKLEIMPKNTEQEKPDGHPNVIEEQIKEKLEYIPEPIMDLKSIEEQKEKRCGAGTMLVDGICKVEQKPVQEEKGFFEWLMSLFGM